MWYNFWILVKSQFLKSGRPATMQKRNMHKKVNSQQYKFENRT